MFRATGWVGVGNDQSNGGGDGESLIREKAEVVTVVFAILETVGTTVETARSSSSEAAGTTEETTGGSLSEAAGTTEETTGGPLSEAAGTMEETTGGFLLEAAIFKKFLEAVNAVLAFAFFLSSLIFLVLP